MATESITASEEVKIDLFEDDDEFEEFQTNKEWEEEEEEEERNDLTQQWEDDWYDDDVSDDFSLQLRREIESNSEKK